MKPVKSNPNMLLLVLFLGVLMGALDIAVVGPALNPMKHWFHVSSKDLTWIFNIYILFNLVGTPLLAKLSDIFGRRTVYVSSIVLFALGSIVVAASFTFNVVIIGRAIQGFGAGGIFPVASAVIGDSIEPEKRGRALGLIGAVFGIAFIIGPVIGGLLLLAGWHWIFLINLPVALLVIYLALRHIPATVSQNRKRFDWQGTLILSLVLAAFVYGINRIDAGNFIRSFTGNGVWQFLTAALVLLITLVFIERKADNPVVAPVLFTTRQFQLAHILSFGAGFAEASLIFIPMMAKTAFHLSNANASFMLLPNVMAMAVGAPIFGRLLDRRGSKEVIMTGSLTVCAGMIVLGLFPGSWFGYLGGTIAIGFGLAALLGAPIRYILLNEAEETERSSAQGLMLIFGSAGQLISAAIIGVLMNSTQNSLTGFSRVYLLIGAFSAALFLVSLLLKTRDAEINKPELIS